MPKAAPLAPEALAYDAETFRMIAKEPGSFGFKPEEIALIMLCAVDEAESLREEVAHLKARLPKPRRKGTGSP